MSAARGASRRVRHSQRRATRPVAPLILFVLGLAACLPVGSALAVFTNQGTVAANTVSTAAAFPRCYSDAVTADSPVSYWRLDETSGTTATDTKGSNTGTYTNGVTLGQSGALPDVVNNKAASFDGSSQYVNVPYSASLNPAQFTLDAWAYLTTTAGDPTVASSFYQLGSSSYKGYWIGSYGQDNWDFQVGYDTGWSEVRGPVVTLNTWTHLVGTYDGTTARFYVNGTLVGSVATSYVANTSAPFGIGSWYYSSGGWMDFWPGLLDDVSVYSTALTAAQVRTHYNSGRCYKDGVLADSPTGYWRLGESSGTTAADGVRGRHGTYTGSPTLAAAGALNGDTNTAVTLNGTSQYVSVPYDSALNPGQVTLEAWAKPTGGAGTARTVIATQDTNKGYLLGIGTDDKWRFTLGTGSATTVVTGPAVALSSWAHVVGSYDGTTATLYVDGLSVATATVTVSVNTTRPLGIGATDAGGSWAGYFPGSLDEPALYSTALSQTRVQAHYLLGRSYKDTVLDSGPVSYWRLGEASSTSAADSKGSNTGTYAGSPTLGQAGALAGDADSSVVLNSTTQNVSVPDSASLRPSQISVEAWINPASASISDFDSPLMKTSNDNWTDGYGLFYRSSGTTMDFYINSWGGAVAATIALDQWTHVVGTYDGATIKLYLNGALAASTAYSTAINHATNSLYIGSGATGSGSAGPAGYFWGGSIDDVAIYNRALPATEVQLHYDSGRQ